MFNSINQPIDLLIRDLSGKAEAGPLPAVSADRLSDNHPLRRQAVIVLDALESVTNGMENPEVRRLLATIPEASPFIPWKNLVHALEAFYRNDPVGVERWMNSIPENSAPKVLEKLLFRLSGISKSEIPLSKIENEILKNIGGEDGFDALTQINEALANDNEAAFSDSVAYLSKELAVANNDISKRIVLWALERLRLHGMSSAILQDHLSLLFGSAEALRLASLSRVGVDNEAALTLWLRYAAEAIETFGAKGEELSALREIGEYLASACPPPREEDFRPIEAAVLSLFEVFDRKGAYPGVPMEEREEFTAFLFRLRDRFTAGSPPKAADREQSNVKRPENKKKPALGQLELSF